MRNAYCAAVAGVVLAAASVPTPSIAGAPPAPAATDLGRCAATRDPAERLRCYDALLPPAGSEATAPAATSAEPRTPPPAGQSAPAAGAKPAAAKPAATASGSSENVFQANLDCGQPVPGTDSVLSSFWELDTKCGRFGLKTYRPNYLLLGRYSNSPNAFPSSPSHPTAPEQSARHTEAKIQLSFRFKVFENLPLGGPDLWAAYSQQSSWQVYDAANSRPFRETDYEPELMLVFPTRYDTHLFGLTGRYTSVGIVHQSNGQSDPLSRSWNRVYAQFGFDKGPFSLQVRPWIRLRERTSSDDNPDLEHFLGHGDLVATWHHEKMQVSLLLRDNLHQHSNRGAAKLDLSFLAWPQHNLRLYFQAFSGYGETLIDYNHRQSTLGVGIMLDQ